MLHFSSIPIKWICKVESWIGIHRYRLNRPSECNGAEVNFSQKLQNQRVLFID